MTCLLHGVLEAARPFSLNSMESEFHGSNTPWQLWILIRWEYGQVPILVRDFNMVASLSALGRLMSAGRAVYTC